METKFYKYASEFLPAKYINVFADAEEKKDLYKFSNTDVLNLIKLCEYPGTMDVEDIIALINKYYNDYENKDMTGNSCIGWARLAMSGFYNSLNERLEGKQYREKDRDKAIDILERYNKTSLKTISIQNLRYFRKVVK